MLVRMWEDGRGLLTRSQRESRKLLLATGGKLFLVIKQQSSPPRPQPRPGLVPWCLQEGRTSSRKAGEQGNRVFGRGYQRNVEGAAWFLLPAFSEMGSDRDGKMALLIRREVKLEGREYSQPVPWAVKNEKSCLRDDFQGVAKRPSDKEMSQSSQ